jgi:hypothetical protein
MDKKVIMEKIDTTIKNSRSLLLCKDEIAGATPYHHTVLAGNEIEFKENSGCYHILLLVQGEAEFITDGKKYSFNERVSFVPAPDKKLTVHAISDVHILEIQWDIIEGDFAELQKYGTKFPLVQVYRTSKQYTDPNKSEKTISRVMIEQRNIPRFCMGSVESYGYDVVRSHDHPMLDQFFFSFPENEMDVLIDGVPVPMGGNILMHIPLGADHGVVVNEGKHMHYMWIDFMVDDTAMERLDRSHRATGLMRSFDNEAK